MSEATVRAAIITAIEDVDDIGQVYDYTRWRIRLGDIVDLLTATIDGEDKIRAWMVTCTGISQEKLVAEENHPLNDVIIWEYSYLIRGVMGLQDSEETEKDAILLAQNLMRALDKNNALQTFLFSERPELPQVATFDTRMFGQYLCHYIEIRWSLKEPEGITA